MRDSPFLQIDSCWAGTHRYLVHPWVDLLGPIGQLAGAQKAMALCESRFRHLCFAGVGNAMRRAYRPAATEVASIKAAWKALDSPRLRARFFPDALALALGWIHEACILGDAQRLKAVEGSNVLAQFGLSWRDLCFLETTFADFLDRWTQVCLIDQLDRDPYRFAIDYLSHDYVWNSQHHARPTSMLDEAALRMATFCAGSLNGQTFEEALVRMRLPSDHYEQPIQRTSWDRSVELQQDPDQVARASSRHRQGRFKRMVRIPKPVPGGWPGRPAQNIE